MWSSNPNSKFDSRFFDIDIDIEIDIDFYFIRQDETIESPEYQAAGLDYKKSRSFTLQSVFYELIAVYDDSNDNQILADRTELLGINIEGNYIITVEKTEDSDTGSKIYILY